MKRNRKVLFAVVFAGAVGLALFGWTSRNGSAQPAPRVSTPVPQPGNTGANASHAVARGNMASAPVTSNGTDLSGKLVDGRYRGDRYNAVYGYVQVETVVSGGRVTDVSAKEYPRHTGTSRYINGIAVPHLVQEVVQAQNSRVYLISGATLTSRAFIMSFDSTLQQALRPEFRTTTSQG